MTMSSPSSGNHCSFVLLAEFDIFEGAQLKYQFPQPLGIDESVLAMSMLPDGAEAQLDDWTIFFLNQTEFNTIEPVLALETDSDSYLEEDHAREEERGKEKKKKKKELLCVLNLVRTKHDKTLDRGAKVLALAICTRHPYIQIFKPVLLIALDDYLLNPSQDVLARLFDAVNAIDFSVAPVLSRDEKLVMRMSERKDIFAEKHKHLYPNYSSSTTQHKSSNSDSSVNNQGVPIRSTAKDDIDPSFAGDVSFGSAVWVGDESAFDISSTTSDSDGATDGASTVIGSTRQRSSTDASSSSSSSHLHLPRIPISRAGSSFGSHDSTVSGIKVGGSSSYMGAGATMVHDTHFFNTTVEYNDHKLPIKMPLSTFSEEVGDYSLITLIRTFSQPTSFSSSSSSTASHSSSHPSLIHPHLHTSGLSTHPIIILFNALVTGKNIIFLGHKRPAGEVSLFVLAACALGSGCGAVLRGFVERAFPYANLNNRDEWESVPAYIAGVTNPIFEASRSWDLLCDISTGTVTVSKDIWTKWPVGPGMGIGGYTGGAAAGLIAPLLTRTGTLKAEALSDEVQKDPGTGVKGEVRYASPDSGGVASADNMFIEDIKTAIEFHYGESLVRVRFMEYVMRFVKLASRYEEETYTLGLVEKEGNRPKTKVGYPSSPFMEGQGGGANAYFGQLGSGLVFNDEASGIKELVANASRIEGWRGTNSYRYFIEDFAHHLAHAPIRNFDVFHQILRLKHASGARKMSDAEAYTIMKCLADGVKGYDQAVELLSYLTPHSGGLLPLAFGLFHQREGVRDATIDLFNQLRAYPVGILYLQSLNHFQRYAYVRLAHAREVKGRKMVEQSQYPYQQSYTGQQPYIGQQQTQYASVPFGRSHSNSSASMGFGSPLGTGIAMPSSYSVLNAG
ncbi:mesa protein [Lentinula detonsa]|uniref:Mesa protein n=1 Tax=Lentinula detonsa TaxID=2804962 RepID=A0A9W8U1J3_9AGAR|nr:mesa protein [Lentinula detonsa]